jgi:hypothetical protein
MKRQPKLPTTKKSRYAKRKAEVTYALRRKGRAAVQAGKAGTEWLSQTGRDKL